MILIFIENKDLLLRLITYFDILKISYTTDIKANFDTLIVGEISNKINYFIKENTHNKKIIFFTSLEELNIYNNYKLTNKKSINYMKKLYFILNKCNLVICDNIFIKKILKIKSRIEVIPVLIPKTTTNKKIKNIYLDFEISKNKKTILLLDLDCINISKVVLLGNLYPKYNFIYMGFKSDYILSGRNKELINNLPLNVKQIKKVNIDIFNEILKISYLVVYFDVFNIEYLLLVIFNKKQLLLQNSIIYDDYLIDSKNVYKFNSKEELVLKFKKVVTNRLANLTNEAYEIAKKHQYDEIIYKYSVYFK
ncbi:MAG: hypothetical protein ACK5HP_01340 [Bacilli bacterium]